MTVGDAVFGLIALALWAAAVWRAVRVGPRGALFSVTVCVAVIVTLKTGLVADPFNLATGGVYLDVVLQHVLGVVAATLILLRLRRELGDPPTRPVWTITGVVVVALVATWFLGPVYDIPADSTWVPEAVLRSPAITANFVLMDAVVALFSVAFARTAVVVAGTRTGPIRGSLRLLAVAAAGLGVNAVLGIVGRVVAIADGATPPWVYAVGNAILAVVFALFAVAVALPGSAALWNRAHHPTPV